MKGLHKAPGRVRRGRYRKALPLCCVCTAVLPPTQRLFPCVSAARQKRQQLAGSKAAKAKRAKRAAVKARRAAAAAAEAEAVEAAEASKKVAPARSPSTRDLFGGLSTPWTVLEQDGPNHLGL